MEVDEPHKDEETGRVFKRRHTDEKPVIHAKCVDDSQAEADKVASELEAVEPSSSNVQLWDDLDAEDWDDPLMVSEYVADVCVYLKEIELATMPNPDYMKDQAEITWEHRGVLIDWLLQVHARFNLLSESFFLCVNILDRFLGSRPISISKVQLVGLACFFIATKFEETYSPSVKEIAYLAADQYTVEEILKAERYILRTLDWDLRAPGPMGWLRRASKADDCEVHARTIAKYLLEVACVERRLIGMVPSLLSAASMWLARLTLGREEWTANLEHYTTYAEKELIPVATIMLEYIITDPVQHESLYKKYAHKRYYRCSTYMRQWSLERWPENGDVNLKKDLIDIKDEIRHHRELSAVKHAQANGKDEGSVEAAKP
ncbi:cyclin-like protein [Flammula alnicola]|nr:cyclin-like protein [Flammula alnicola]